MILADTAIWIDHIRKADPLFQWELDSENVATHPMIVAELALGTLPDRIRTLEGLDRIQQVELATLAEVRLMVEVHALNGRGIGVVDAFLLASTLITPETQFWTRDKRLNAVAKELGISADLA